MSRVQQVLQRFIIGRAPAMDEERGPQAAAPVGPDIQITENTTEAQRGAQPASDPFLLPGEPLRQEISDQLKTFRHLIGISTERSMATIPKPAIIRPGERPAPNLGLYSRVVNNERIAKSGYKYYSIAINSCLGTQIIVAAALTAMGAADTNHAAITAFGAINTVIAGFLTYLKGSGLPNRLKYYHNEWKKLREYIEQRERDLSRPSGAFLDVYAIVGHIERMYDETKSDIEVNTPDGYISVANIKQRVALHERPMSMAQGSQTGSKVLTQDQSLDMLRSSSVNSKLKGVEVSLAEKLHEADHSRQDITKDVEKGEQTFSARVRELRGSIDDRVRDLSANIDQSTREVARDIDSQGRQTSTRAREMEHSAVQETIRDIQEHARRKIDELTAKLSH